MHTALPEEEGATSLNARIEARLAEIRNTEGNIPCVITIHDIRSWHLVYMSQRGLDYLDVSLESLRASGLDYHKLYFNPEDSEDYVPKILGLLESRNDDEIVSYFQQVRRSPEHEWNWFLSSTKVILRDEHGKPVLTLSTSIPVDAQHHVLVKAQRMLEENNFHRRHNDLFGKLTRQEKEVLKHLAMGQSSAEIAQRLHISEATANTHRRNIKGKLNARNNYDLSMFARAFDLI